MTRKLILTAAAVAIAITGFTTTFSSEAEAGRGASRYQQWEYDTGRRPARGYEGFAGGPGKAYCSYRREPERKCWYTRSGRERCKIVNWRLIQKCY